MGCHALLHFVWATITEIPQTGWLTHSSRGWKSQDEGTSRFSVWRGPASWFTHSSPLSVSLYGKRSEDALRGLFYWVHSAQSCPTLCDSMDCSLQGSSVHEISQARILDWTHISCVSCIGRWILYHCANWEAPFIRALVIFQTLHEK